MLYHDQKLKSMTNWGTLAASGTGISRCVLTVLPGTHHSPQRKLVKGMGPWRTLGGPERKDRRQAGMNWGILSAGCKGRREKVRCEERSQR